MHVSAEFKFFKFSIDFPLAMEINKLFSTLVIWSAVLSATPVMAQTWVKVNYDTGEGTSRQQIEAVFRPAEGVANGQALLILHHAGGFSFNTTKQYGEFFSKLGFVTLELKMFNDSRNRPDPIALHGQVMGGLKYLSAVPGVDQQKISAMGMSLGAFLTIDAASSWFYEQYQAGDLRFNKLIALYPVCWVMSEAVKGQTQEIRPFIGMPSTYLQRWVGIPLLILAAGKDNYDGLDALACPAFAKSIPDVRQAEVTRVEVYQDATHGWDHGRDYSFLVNGGCSGRISCTNRIVFSSETVERGKQAVLKFLTTP